MFKRELKINFKNFIVWSFVFVALFSLIFAIYPTMIEANRELIDQILQIFPEDVLEAFNVTSISSPFGWITSKGIDFVLLCIGIYASILGGNALYKEKADKTIEYLSSKPVKRSEIMIKKVLADLILITALDLLVSLTCFVGLYLNNDVNISETFIVTLTPLLSFFVLYSLSLLISVLYKATPTLTVGLPFLFYAFLAFSRMTDGLSFLRYLTPFSLSDTKVIVDNGYLPAVYYIIGLSLFTLLLGTSLYSYNKKELV
ncbi:MAG: ABC transporter permease subunit [Bacillales bacterium]|nr:ABC transporter permease subunit [Bacillales bacterium]